MNRLENLPEIVARQLGGLEATPVLQAKIKREAARATPVKRPVWRPAAAVALALALLVGGAALWRQGPSQPLQKNVIDSHSAGVDVAATQVPTVGDLPKGVISLGTGASSASQTLFAASQGSSFPLIMVNGATYRMLASPDGISSGLLGETLGTVNEYNIEPALGSGSIVSNAASQGETVYAVGGRGGALVAASVNGGMRVFQRVSYAGTAIIGSETLGDTLCASGDVSWMTLAGVGTVEGSDAQALMDTLLSSADYQSTGMSGSGSLQIGLNNGLTLQLLVGDDTVSACGTWSCPEFFETFHEAVGQ